MFANEDRDETTHYCPQCGDRYYGEVYCVNCDIKTVPIQRGDGALLKLAKAARSVA